MCSTADIVRYGVVVELAGYAIALAGYAIALVGIYRAWKSSGGAGAVKTALDLLARALDSIEKAVHTQEPETIAHAGTARVTVTAYEASGSSMITFTGEAVGTWHIPDRIDRLEWQLQSLTGSDERLTLELKAIGKELAALRCAVDTASDKHEKDEREARSRLRNGLVAGTVGVVFFIAGTLATSLPVGAEHLLCG
jgi:hypothetical protein